MPSPKNSPRRTSKARGVLIGASIATAAALLGLASYSATKPEDRNTVTPTLDTSSPTAPAAGAQNGVHPELAKLARRTEGDPLAQGRADAPVVLVEYADFKCGYCGKFARDTEPELVKKYVDNGTLRIEWRNFPIFGDESEAVARTSWAAGQQGVFWPFHQAAYAKDAKAKGYGKDRLTEIAREAGVKDLARFAADSDSAGARAAVRKDQEEAYGLGATSTPSFLVNGEPIAGAQPDEVFEQAVERAARAAAAAKSGAAQGNRPTQGAPGNGEAQGAPGNGEAQGAPGNRETQDAPGNREAQK
ncbi:DsbA family protein [Streptomyces sp. NPDC091272]|uniref:DsbA family protein n=1 Tax=Streptomyces sp. NPDC091272 TaxID=3365981 RepID=UPI00381F5AF7